MLWLVAGYLVGSSYLVRKSHPAVVPDNRTTYNYLANRKFACIRPMRGPHIRSGRLQNQESRPEESEAASSGLVVSAEGSEIHFCAIEIRMQECCFFGKKFK